MPKSRIRKKLGLVKYKVLDCWPYKFKELRAAKLREKLRPKAFELPQIPAPDSVDVEIHMLCGKSQLDMGIWASWSVMRFLKEAVLYVHSDGTLTNEDIEKWQQVVKPLHYIDAAIADERVKEVLSEKCPLLHKWRCNYWSGSQVIDVHLFGHTKSILVLDSDVLCFSDPVELQKEIRSGNPVCRWNKDVQSAYSESIDILNEITDVEMPEAFNCGFCLMPRMGLDEFEYLEKQLGLLRADGRVDLEHVWSGQTYYAMCATKWEGGPLPDTFAVTLGRTSDDMVVRHYTGVPAIRPRYFTEGIPKLGLI